jgi:hypothetical protein
MRRYAGKVRGPGGRRLLIVAVSAVLLLLTASGNGPRASAATSSRPRERQVASRLDGLSRQIRRPVSERVPGGVRTVLVARSVRQSSGGAESGITFTYTLTDTAKISQITRWLNALPIEQPGQTSCNTHPGVARSIRLTFKSAVGTTLATATDRTNSPNLSTACNTVSFTVRGHQYIPLADGSRFLAQLDQLLPPQTTLH